MVDEPAATGESVRRTVEAVWRLESARILGRLTRLVGDLGTAEDIAHDALVAALDRWPKSGVPDNPGAWLTAVAKFQAVDLLRRRDRLVEKTEQLQQSAAHAPDLTGVELERIDDDRIDDDVLAMILMTCHPVLTTDARVALTLRVVGGLRTDEIARAFLVPEATLAQRIVRAKRALAAVGVAFGVPDRNTLRERLASVLEVILLIFNEGYAATSGEDWVRPALCEDALRLGRILAHLVPSEPEVHGLVALMEIQASRTAARTSATGEPVLLLDQDRSRWNQLLIRRGLAALERAQALGGPPGPYVLQGQIAACHAGAGTAEETDWGRMATLYESLARVMPSPVVELNRAVAVAASSGPAAGLSVVDPLLAEPTLERYHLLPSVRGDLLARLGRLEEARSEFRRAASLTGNERERRLLLARAAECERPGSTHNS